MKNTRKILIEREAPEKEPKQESILSESRFNRYSRADKSPIKPHKIINVTLGNKGEEDEVRFEDFYANPFILFCTGIRDISWDLKKISKFDVMDKVIDCIPENRVYTPDGEWMI